MDLTTIGQLITLYVISLIYVYSTLAACSYVYYVRKSHASIETQKHFQSTLGRPAKWLFSGEKPLIESMIFRKRIDEYLQQTTLFEIQYARGFSVFFSIIIGPIGGILGIRSVEASHLIVQYLIYIVVHSYSLWASIGFGHKLMSMSKAAEG